MQLVDKLEQTDGNLLFKREQHHATVLFTHTPTLSSKSERSKSTTPQAIVNQFHRLYKKFGFVGCSSLIGIRIFITNAARKISSVG
jgi:hypothetical protein